MASKQDQSVQGLIDAHIKKAAAQTVKRELRAAIEEEIRIAADHYGCLGDGQVRKAVHQEFLAAATDYIRKNPERVAKQIIERVIRS